MRTRLRRAIARAFKPPARGTRLRGEGIAGAMELVFPPVIFTLLGVWLDGMLGTGPLLAIALFFFSVAGTTVSAYYRYRATSSVLDEGKPWNRAAERS